MNREIDWRGLIVTAALVIGGVVLLVMDRATEGWMLLGAGGIQQLPSATRRK